ncbi:gluconate:H+ symporter, GntP family [Marivirga sericea]|uniref:Gluconate:H+ symporter, GntP family n=1 Tax=Marivirga sericea TaxID=1028 RepID=A0A1X7J2N0_9BACT|nr:GntP family permease [Marivirga sericea]SMG21836.1 gluconate:H+ symporter, GntP family [Marivirga sericea]
MADFYTIIFWIVLSITLIILGTARFKMHPALVLFTVALFTAVGLGFQVTQSVEIVALGFGNMLSNIGILILLGCVLAVILEELQSIKYLSTLFIKIFGLNRPFLLLSSLGGLIGIPVFCDVAYIILSDFSKTLASQAKVSRVSTSVTIASSLYIAHNLIPPTPGPLAVMGNFGVADQLGLIFLLGIGISIFLILILSLYARFVSRNTLSSDTETAQFNHPANALPTVIILPLIIPIILIAISSILGIVKSDNIILNSIEVIGNPIIALAIGVLIGLILLKKQSEDPKSELIKKAILQAGPILVITGLGGSYGQVIKESAFSDLLIENINFQTQGPFMILIIAYLMAFFIKTAQGSSTSAMIIVSAIVAPLIPGSSLDTVMGTSLLVLAIGSGAMMVSHSNDSYFWVVKEFSGMSVKQALKTFSISTMLLSVTSMLLVMLLFLLL